MYPEEIQNEKMPSLRKRVSTYLRQLSFHNEPREKKNNVNENAFVTKYLQGHISLQEGPPIIYGKTPTDLPNYELAKYESGTNTVVGCYSGPNGGLTTVKRTEKHLSVPDDDIDFIDNPEEEEHLPPPMPKISPKRVSGQPIDNTTMVIKVAGNEYCVTNKPKRHSKSFSLGSISDFNIEVEKTKIDKDFYNCDNKKDSNSNNHHSQCIENQIQCDTSERLEEGCEGTITTDIKSEISITNSGTNNNTKSEQVEESCHLRKLHIDEVKPKVNITSQMSAKHPSASKSRFVPNTTVEPSKNYALAKSRSEGNPFHNKKRGKVIQVQRQHSQRDDSTENQQFAIDDASLPAEWTRKSDCFYGVSDSLYDRNQVTKQKNGDPIADCFGLITRNDSAILAVADGVNWGEKASIAAKSAIHASLHYLNKTIFNDTKPFEKLTTKTDDVALSSDALSTDETTNLIANTREVFVCLLRAFNCAHDLILENQGMLTTLTVAVILPLNETRSQRHENGIHSNNRKSHYVCCVCNVGDTLAYVYSQKSGIRELTKGSHDVNSNRDMRDALGALGPVDGINPELSNLTLSITTLNEGDIVLVASDGLTDNFDPNVCRFTVNTVNSKADVTKNRVQNTSSSGVAPSHLPNSQLQGNARLLEGRTQPSSVNSQRAEGVISQKPPIKPPRRSKNRGSISSASQSERSASSVEKDNVPISEAPNQGYVNKNLAAVKTKDLTEMENPLVAHFVKENSPGDHRTVKSEVKKQRAVIDNKASSLRKQVSTQNRTELDRKVPPAVKANPNTLDSSFAKQKTQTHKFLKSKTSLDLRSSHQNKIQIPRNVDGIPFVTPYQRYELQLLLMEDILKNGISGNDSPITTAKRLCENLVSFTMSITSAKRRTLEDQDMYFDHRNGVLVEVSNQEKKLRRKKGLEKVQSLPGIVEPNADKSAKKLRTFGPQRKKRILSRKPSERDAQKLIPSELEASQTAATQPSSSTEKNNESTGIITENEARKCLDINALKEQPKGGSSILRLLGGPDVDLCGCPPVHDCPSHANFNVFVEEKRRETMRKKHASCNLFCEYRHMQTCKFYINMVPKQPETETDKATENLDISDRPIDTKSTEASHCSNIEKLIGAIAEEHEATCNAEETAEDKTDDEDEIDVLSLLKQLQENENLEKLGLMDNATNLQDLYVIKKIFDKKDNSFSYALIPKSAVEDQSEEENSLPKNNLQAQGTNTCTNEAGTNSAILNSRTPEKDDTEIAKNKNDETVTRRKSFSKSSDALFTPLKIKKERTDEDIVSSILGVPPEDLPITATKPIKGVEVDPLDISNNQTEERPFIRVRPVESLKLPCSLTVEPLPVADSLNLVIPETSTSVAFPNLLADSLPPVPAIVGLIENNLPPPILSPITDINPEGTVGSYVSQRPLYTTSSPPPLHMCVLKLPNSNLCNSKKRKAPINRPKKPAKRRQTKTSKSRKLSESNRDPLAAIPLSLEKPLTKSMDAKDDFVIKKEPLDYTGGGDDFKHPDEALTKRPNQETSNLSKLIDDPPMNEDQLDIPEYVQIKNVSLVNVSDLVQKGVQTKKLEPKPPKDVDNNSPIRLPQSLSELLDANPKKSEPEVDDVLDLITKSTDDDPSYDADRDPLYLPPAGFRQRKRDFKRFIELSDEEKAKRMRRSTRIRRKKVDKFNLETPKATRRKVSKTEAQLKCVLPTKFTSEGDYVNDHDYFISPYARNRMASVRRKGGEHCICLLCDLIHLSSKHVEHMSAHYTKCAICCADFKNVFVLNMHVRKHTSHCKECKLSVTYARFLHHAETHNRTPGMSKILLPLPPKFPISENDFLDELKPSIIQPFTQKRKICSPNPNVKKSKRAVGLSKIVDEIVNTAKELNSRKSEIIESHVYTKEDSSGDGQENENELTKINNLNSKTCQKTRSRSTYRTASVSIQEPLNTETMAEKVTIMEKHDDPPSSDNINLSGLLDDAYSVKSTEPLGIKILKVDETVINKMFACLASANTLESDNVDFTDMSSTGHTVTVALPTEKNVEQVASLDAHIRNLKHISGTDESITSVTSPAEADVELLATSDDISSSTIQAVDNNVIAVESLHRGEQNRSESINPVEEPQ
ncbi:hypothetical protein HUJ04_000760 [Dendroctonus ponderosae]|nr:hypothetical protein HUJ04_000760 [Dendroctonus ponderosae]